ncbi:MAG: hypothetical protein ACRD9S_03470 [Pyrinomonadaceae bacterium]
MATKDEAIEIKRKNSAYLLGLPGVVGVGVVEVDSGSYGLLLHVESDDQDVLQRIPERIEVCPVKIEKSGRYRKF